MGNKREVEVRQTDSHGTITARDNYKLTRNIPKCVGVERLCESANFQIHFNADEINLINQFGKQSKAEYARVGNYLDILKEFWKIGISKIKEEKQEYYQRIIGDKGQYAAVKEYDVIDMN